MENSKILILASFCVSLIFASGFYSASATAQAVAPNLCPPQSLIFIAALHSQCPSLSIAPSAPLLVDGEFLDGTLGSSSQRNAYMSVLFYASWCPFSSSAKPSFNVLSSMFPQMTHLMVEESSVMPIVLSRYGVHSLPSIFLVNGTSGVRYYGSKDLGSIVKFYKTITGLKPVQGHSLRQSRRFESEKSIMWNDSRKEFWRREPYLAFSMLFVCLKLFLYLFPGIILYLEAIWVSYGWHMNLRIFGEISQLLGRILHVISLKRVWSKLRVCKATNFHNGAKNARVWASSLASVSLGESS